MQKLQSELEPTYKLLTPKEQKYFDQAFDEVINSSVVIDAINDRMIELAKEDKKCEDKIK